MNPCFLVGDVGGTNARLALVQPGSTQLQQVQVRQCNDFPTLQAAITDYLENAGQPDILAACLAVACPVNSERIQFTNNPWSFTRDELKNDLRLPSVLLVNDFQAMALGMLQLAPQEQLQLAPELKWTGQTRAVVGPGTGLGFSALVPSNGNWVPLATEGGHVGFVPRDETEIDILRILMKRHNNRVSAERLLCGQGLVNIHSCLAEIQGMNNLLNTPAEVTDAAANGDEFARQALNRFCNMLGAYAGDMVLAVGALGGVYLCGGILPRIQPFFLESDFLLHFRSKGRFSELMQQVPVSLSLAEYPGLAGSAVFLSNSYLP